jgi:hypothetical protein
MVADVPGWWGLPPRSPVLGDWLARALRPWLRVLGRARPRSALRTARARAAAASGPGFGCPARPAAADGAGPGPPVWPDCRLSPRMGPRAAVPLLPCGCRAGRLGPACLPGPGPGGRRAAPGRRTAPRDRAANRSTRRPVEDRPPEAPGGEPPRQPPSDRADLSGTPAKRGTAGVNLAGAASPWRTVPTRERPPSRRRPRGPGAGASPASCAR